MGTTTGKILKDAVKKCAFKLPFHTLKFGGYMGRIEVSGTDGESYIRTVVCENHVTQGSWVRVVNTEDVKKAIKKAKTSTPITIEVVDKGLAFSLGGVSITVKAVDEERFPSMPSMERPVDFSTDKHFGDTLKLVSEAATKDDTRFAVSAVLVEGGDIVATDGHRLYRAKSQRELPKMLIPLCRGFDILAAQGNSCYGMSDGNLAEFVLTDKTVVCIRLKDDPFPQYEKVIPNGEASVIVGLSEGKRSELARKLELMPVSQKNMVELDIGETIVLSSEDGDTKGKATLNWGTTFSKIVVGFNKDYLIAALKHDLNEMRFTKPENPLYMKGDGLDVVIMPMRV